MKAAQIGAALEASQRGRAGPGSATTKVSRGIPTSFHSKYKSGDPRRVAVPSAPASGAGYTAPDGRPIFR